MSEQWKNVRNFPGYKVSNYGRVRSIGRIVEHTLRSGKIVKLFVEGRLLTKSSQGSVCLSKNGKYRNKQVANLVAQHFIPNPHKMHFVRKLKGKSCKASNLYWSFSSYDLANQPAGEEHYNAKLSQVEVTEILSLAGKFTNKFIAKKFKIDQSMVQHILAGHRWKFSGAKKPAKNAHKKYRKISAIQANNIRKAYKLGHYSQCKLAKKYGVSQPVIFDIVHGRTHV